MSTVKRLVTGGGDSLLKIWRLVGTLMFKLTTHCLLKMALPLSNKSMDRVQWHSWFCKTLSPSPPPSFLPLQILTILTLLSSSSYCHPCSLSLLGCSPLPHTLPLSREDSDTNWTLEEKLEGHSDWVRDVAWCPSVGLPISRIASCSQVIAPPKPLMNYS